MSVNDIIASLNKDPELTTFHDTDEGEIKDFIPTMIPIMDYNLIGGIPVSGQISEIFGAPSSGKSTFSATIIRNGLKMGILPIYFDVEGTQRASRLQELGVDPDRVLTFKLSRDKNGIVHELSVEKIGAKIIDILAKIHDADPNQITVFFWDSIAMTNSEMQATNDLGQALVGQQAKALATVGRKIQANLNLNNGALIAFNQARDDFNAPIAKYAQVKTVGGKAWTHLLSTRIQFAQSGKIKAKTTDDKPIGTETRVKVVKSKVGDNFGADFKVAIIGKSGYDFEYNLVIGAQELGLITTGRSPKFTDANGEVLITGKNIYDLSIKLKEPENQDIVTQIWQNMVLHYFPDCYPALFNTTLIMRESDFPVIRGMRKYYIERQRSIDPRLQDYNYVHFMEAYNNKKLPKDIMEETKETLKELGK